ncbi:MAG: hypothetical protein KIS66_06675 [Fimbriimonadaceae bacterium]|nr:hypothetical protein [Fimbriimonadaceae bacterium]
MRAKRLVYGSSCDIMGSDEWQPERKVAAFDRMTAKVPQLWRSRNHDTFAPVVWAAAYARLGIASVANEAVDFAQRHFAGTPEGLLNHEQMWLDTAQKWASGQDWRLV